MKKYIYNEPEFKVVKTSHADIITTSEEGGKSSIASAFTDWESRTRSPFWFDL
ncbi:MAG: hypothetical protein IJ851_02750 [Eubacterium sp.]|nr:hypothetical protein [Eubacterium sp.]